MPQLELRAVFEPDPEVLRRLEEGSKVGLTQETIMADVSKLQAIAARLQASDTAALAALQQLKDQNTALAAQLSAVPVTDPDVQKAIDCKRFPSVSISGTEALYIFSPVFGSSLA